ncbi:unnamed protein product [Prunus armeniaca]|uniref:DUF6821 domain-containing protein n=1 Tax=Prunus armeniaca TaxID=36596 RepID=A0A6J5XYW5_PRUAR|nr:unnamed protein product [Prunus armeniaca]
MDLDEWEYLPDDGFLDFHEEREEKRIFSSKASSDSKSVFNMNYFIIPSPNSRKLIETPPPIPPQGFINSRVPNQLVPVPIQLELPPSFVKASEEDERVPAARILVDEKTNYKAKALEADDQDTQLSQVYFKKTWENEFADMKMDSPKSPTCRSPRFMQHQTTDAAAAVASIESKITSPRMKIGEKNNNLFDSEDTKKEEEEEDDDLVKNGRDHNRNNIWKLSLTGIGAICSFGFAAATICVLFFGTHQRNKQYQQNQNRYQIYTDDNKRIKQAVEHATKFNEAFSAVRGVPITRAHVTFGGHYNGL